MTTPTKKHTARKLRLAALAIGVAVILPSMAQASPFDCSGASCPGVNINYIVGASPTITNEASTLTNRINAQDGSAPATSFDYMLPQGWRLALESIRPANDDPAANNCNSIYAGSQPRTLTTGEAIGVVAMQVAAHSPDDVSDPVSGTYNFGNASFGFLSYDATTGIGHACIDVYSKDIAGASPDPFGFVGSDINNMSEFMFPVTITRLPSTATYGWDVKVDLSSFLKSPTVAEYSASITSLDVTLNDRTGGKWNRNQSGKPQPVNPFSETPAVGSNSPTAVIDTFCTGKVDSATASGCSSDATAQITKLGSIVVQDPPAQLGVHPFAALTGVTAPSSAGVANVLADGNSLVRGTNAIVVNWNQPGSTSTLDTIRGYVLAVAHPGDKASEYFRYMVTQSPTTAGFDATVCGADGKASKCSTTLTFPQVGIGGHVLDGNDKYNLVLITLYADGHRSDGKFDPQDASGTALCPGGADVVSCGDGIIDASKPKFRIDGQGKSFWQVFVTSQNFTSAYEATNSYAPSDGHTTTGVTLPQYVLLVDFPSKHGVFIDYQPGLGAPAVVYSANSNLIQSPNDTDGAVVFGNLSATGAAQTWEFIGQIQPTDPNCLNPLTGCVIGANGVFIQYDPKNVTVNPTGSIPPDPSKVVRAGGLPGPSNIAIFSGVPVA